jgi:hypothetical protein
MALSGDEKDVAYGDDRASPLFDEWLPPAEIVNKSGNRCRVPKFPDSLSHRILRPEPAGEGVIDLLGRFHA